MTQVSNFELIGEKVADVTKTLFMEIEKRINDGFNFNKIENVDSNILELTRMKKEFEEKNPVGVQVLLNHLDYSAHRFVLTILGKEMREDMGDTPYELFSTLMDINNDADLAKHFVYVSLVTAVMQRVHGLNVSFNTFMEISDAVDEEKENTESQYQELIAGVVEIGAKKIAELYDISDMKGKNAEVYIQSLIEQSLSANGTLVKDSPLHKLLGTVMDNKFADKLVPQIVAGMVTDGKISLEESMKNTDEIFMEVITEFTHVAFSTVYALVNEKGIKSAEEITSDLVKEHLDRVFMEEKGK